MSNSKLKKVNPNVSGILFNPDTVVVKSPDGDKVVDAKYGGLYDDTRVESSTRLEI